MTPKKNLEYKYNKIGLYFEIFSRGDYSGTILKFEI